MNIEKKAYLVRSATTSELANTLIDDETYIINDKTAHIFKHDPIAQGYFFLCSAYDRVALLEELNLI